MDFFWQINWEEMLGDLIVTTFVILLPTSIVVVCSMVMFPLIDLAFKKKAKTWHHVGLTPHHAQLLQPAVQEHAAPYPLVGMAHHAFADTPLGRITPLIVRSPLPNDSEGAPPGPVAASPMTLNSSCGRASEALSRETSAGDPTKEEPGHSPCAA
jgi:hypothetical protein